MFNAPLEAALESFAAELAQWRVRRGLSKKRLAAEMGFDPSYLSHVEGRRHRPTDNFAERAEAVLHTGGAIWRSYLAYAQAATDRPHGNRVRPASPAIAHWLPPGSGVLVEDEVARLVYQDGRYEATITRQLYNAGTEPITRFPVRVSVDRYPANQAWSNLYYREHPLTVSELGFSATWGDAPGEPMDWRLGCDRDSYKKIVLMLEGRYSRFPLYPGQRATVTYAYQVGEAKWGQWFERQVRLPTQRLSVELRFPTGYQAAVWGTHISLSNDAPLGTPIVESEIGDRTAFSWSTDHPSLRSRFRLQWRFRTAAGSGAAGVATGVDLTP